MRGLGSVYTLVISVGAVEGIFHLLLVYCRCCRGNIALVISVL